MGHLYPTRPNERGSCGDNGLGRPRIEHLNAIAGREVTPEPANQG
jgi:hypothetical protein